MRKIIWLLLPFIFGSLGCNRADGDRLARVARMAAEKMQALIPQRTPFGASFPLPGADSLEHRVRSRIEADKYLASTPIEATIEANAVRLRGVLREEVLKKRLIELIESTTGVEQVIDEVRVEKADP